MRHALIHTIAFVICIYMKSVKHGGNHLQPFNADAMMNQRNFGFCFKHHNRLTTHGNTDPIYAIPRSPSPAEQ